MMGNFDDIYKTQENNFRNNYYHQIKTFSQSKDTTKKIKCKEKNFINIKDRNFIQSLHNNYNYSKTTKIKNNKSFQNKPIQTKEENFINIFNNKDLINEQVNNINNEDVNKDKKFLNVKSKSKNYQSYHNLKNFFNNEENNKNENHSYYNNFHFIKSEKKLINIKQNFNINPISLTNNKTSGKSKQNFYFLNNSEVITKANNENPFCKTENNFYNSKLKNQEKNIKSLINNSNQISQMNIEFSNKSTKIKNIFVKHKTQNQFGIPNLKLESINKKKEDCVYIKSNNKIIFNNNKIINKDNKENNIINYIYNSNTTNSYKNYKISNQNKKQNFININSLSRNKLYNFENNFSKDGHIFLKIGNSQDKKLNKTNPNIKICNNQIIYNDNKNIFIQNNYITDKLHFSNEKLPTDNTRNKTFTKNKSFDNAQQYSKKNYITNLKNFIPNTEQFKSAFNNIKNFLLGNKDEVEFNYNKEKKVEDNNNNNQNNKNTEDKSTIIDDSIIMNSSDVYGTLNFSKTLNANDKSPEKINKEKNINLKNINDINENELYINSYSNQRETISMENMKKNNPNLKQKETKKIMISELLRNNNSKSHKKENIKEYINMKSIKNNVNPENKTINEINNYKNFSVVSIAGKNFGVKKINQDTPVASVNINGIKGFNIFGVLDGHGTNGHYVSNFLGKYLVQNISKDKEILETKNLDNIYQIIKKSNYEVLINIFLKADGALSKQNFDVSFSGTTCVLVIQIGKKIICANVGDSRAILVYNNNNINNEQKTSIYNLSHDFKPDLPEEKKRIYKMGGIVEQMLDMNGMRAGPPRVWGVGKSYPGLAMSRSLGDFKGKRYGIISLPEIIEVNLDENSKYIVFCSDGVWEFLSNHNVMEIGNEFYEKNDVAGFTKKLTETATNMWEQKDVIVDDITAVVVFY